MHTHARTHVRTHARMHTCTHAHTRVRRRACLHGCTNTCTSACTSTHTCTSALHTRAQACQHITLNTHMHRLPSCTYMRTHERTRTHARTSARVRTHTGIATHHTQDTLALTHAHKHMHVCRVHTHHLSQGDTYQHLPPTQTQTCPALRL